MTIIDPRKPRTAAEAAAREREAWETVNRAADAIDEAENRHAPKETLAELRDADDLVTEAAQAADEAVIAFCGRTLGDVRAKLAYILEWRAGPNDDYEGRLVQSCMDDIKRLDGVSAA